MDAFIPNLSDKGAARDMLAAAEAACEDFSGLYINNGMTTAHNEVTGLKNMASGTADENLWCSDVPPDASAGTLDTVTKTRCRAWRRSP